MWSEHRPGCKRFQKARSSLGPAVLADLGWSPSVRKSKALKAVDSQICLCRGGRPPSQQANGGFISARWRPFCGLAVAAVLMEEVLDQSHRFSGSDDGTKKKKKKIQLSFVKQEPNAETARLFVCTVSISAALTRSSHPEALPWWRDGGDGGEGFDSSLWGFQPVNLNEAVCVPVCLSQERDGS